MKQRRLKPEEREAIEIIRKDLGLSWEDLALPTGINKGNLYHRVYGSIRVAQTEATVLYEVLKRDKRVSFLENLSSTYKRSED